MSIDDETPTPPHGAGRAGSQVDLGVGGGWSARPGHELAVLGARLAVVLPGSQAGLAAALWPRVDAGAGLEEVLDTLLAPGLTGLSDAVLVAREGSERVTVLVRGHRFRVEVGGEAFAQPVVVDGAGARTWVERSFDEVATLTVIAEGADGTGDQPAEPGWTGTGLLRVSRVAAPSSSAPAVEVIAAEGARRGTADRPPDRPIDRAVGPAEPPQPVRPPEAPLDDHDHVDDDDHDDHDGPPTGPPGPVVAVLAFGDGTRVSVDDVVLVGRAPAPRGLHRGRPPRAVVVSSPQLAVSATHLEVRPGTGPDAGYAVVTDLGSTNGTVLAPPDRDSEELVAGVGARLEPGSVVHLGDGVVFEVLRA